MTAEQLIHALQTLIAAGSVRPDAIVTLNNDSWSYMFEVAKVYHNTRSNKVFIDIVPER